MHTNIDITVISFLSYPCTLLITSRVTIENSFFMGTRVTPSARGVSFSTILSTHSLKAGMRVFRWLGENEGDERLIVRSEFTSVTNKLTLY